MSSEGVSVIIPTYNQASRLAMTLQSLCHQQVGADDLFEVIVIDDGSEDETPTVLRDFANLLPLKSCFQQRAGRAAARNAGIAMSSYPLILFTDADRPLENTWIRAHRTFHERQNRAVGIGDIQEFYFSHLEEKIPLLREEMKSNYTGLLRLSRPYRYWKLIKQTLDDTGCCQLGAPWAMCLIGNLSVRRELLEASAGFDQTFTGWGFEHFELGYRLYQQGASFWYVPQATNYHLAHARPDGFYREQMAYSFAQFVAKHPDAAAQNFIHFLQGEITLGDFDRIATAGVSQLSLEKQQMKLSVLAFNS
ncbi:glycosyl transferase [Tengunoibacter tsumagoiensis]|uniref:Glycosyl transferase n=2 Tax=Tengunoibacter tsumagoiensis TaxID=2014871 RepID=A0A402A737_9CHLR|nr:glycosyl transferase [Tengunoibacter tsumagoiensis]